MDYIDIERQQQARAKDLEKTITGIGI